MTLILQFQHHRSQANLEKINERFSGDPDIKRFEDETFKCEIHQRLFGKELRIIVDCFDNENRYEFIHNHTQAGLDIGVVVYGCDDYLDFKTVKLHEAGHPPWNNPELLDQFPPSTRNKWKKLPDILRNWLQETFGDVFDETIIAHLVPTLVHWLEHSADRD